MATTPVRVIPANASKIFLGGTPVIAMFGGARGGIIVNPNNADDQGIGTVENLYYSLVGPAATSETAGTFTLVPGQALYVPPGITTDVSINAATTGHRFSAVVFQDITPFPPTPIPSTFPPDGPTSLLKTIPAYLYEQYADDDDLQAWVRAFNAQMQDYIDWFNQVGLPVYTGTLISGGLLDWVAIGLYGMKRPVLASGQNRSIGPYNTAMFNQMGYNQYSKLGQSNVSVTTDDLFKRIMTWNLYRGDGKTFSLTWLKRRIARFLNGPNGTDPVIDNTYDISAVYGSRTQVNVVLPANLNSTILKEAMDSRVVTLPFQLNFSVTIAT